VSVALVNNSASVKRVSSRYILRVDQNHIYIYGHYTALSAGKSPNNTVHIRCI